MKPGGHGTAAFVSVAGIAAVIALFNAASVYADERRAAYESRIDECNYLASRAASECIVGIQADLDAELATLLQRSIDLLAGVSFTGVPIAQQEDAVRQVSDRLRQSNEAWKTYRRAHCFAAERFYTRSPIYPASASHRIALCWARKSLDRIEEIQRAYLTPFYP